MAERSGDEIKRGKGLLSNALRAAAIVGALAGPPANATSADVSDPTTSSERVVLPDDLPKVISKETIQEALTQRISAFSPKIENTSDRIIQDQYNAIYDMASFIQNTKVRASYILLQREALLSVQTLLQDKPLTKNQIPPYLWTLLTRSVDELADYPGAFSSEFLSAIKDLKSEATAAQEKAAGNKSIAEGRQAMGETLTARENEGLAQDFSESEALTSLVSILAPIAEEGFERTARIAGEYRENETRLVEDVANEFNDAWIMDGMRGERLDLKFKAIIAVVKERGAEEIKKMLSEVR